MVINICLDMFNVVSIETANGTITAPTFLDSMVSQGVIRDNIFGLSFAPPTNDSDENGKVSLGDLDRSLFKGHLKYT